MRTLSLLLVLAGCQSTWTLDDADGDGFTVVDGDCDDTDPDITPNTPEVCNGIDDNCDGQIDGDGAEGATEFFADDDGDGWGNAERSVIACDAPEGYVETSGDCDDSNEDRAPDLDEVCDDLDNDCNGEVDDDPSDGQTWYEDRDQDGLGSLDRPIQACEQPPNTTDRDDATDCYDDDDTAFPGSHATEVPGDGIDQDCDGLDACVDPTCDGYPDLVVGGYRSGAIFTQDVEIYAGNEAGLFDKEPFATIPAHSVEELAVTDLDQDGWLDIVWISAQVNGSGALSVAYGGDRGYAAGKRGYDGDQPRDLLITDLDDDGYDDVVISGYNQGATYVADTRIYYGSDSPLGVRTDTLPGVGTTALAAGDLDGDGAVDLVLCNEQTGIAPFPYATASTLYWGAAGGFSETRATPVSTTGCRDVAITDLNDDARPDLAFAEWRDKGGPESASKVVFNDGARFATPGSLDVSVTAACSVLAEDLDDDGAPELIYGFDASVDEVWARPYVVARNTGGAFTTSTYTAEDVRHPSLADLDGDGDLDVIAPVYGELDGAIQTFDAEVLINEYDEGGGLVRETLSLRGALRIAAYDVDEDGDLDLVSTNAGSGGAGGPQVQVWRNDGSGRFGSRPAWTVDTPRVRAAAVVVGRDVNP